MRLRASGAQVLYWLGNFDEKNTQFLLDGALGPLRLDLGDLLYAPNLLRVEQVGVCIKLGFKHVGYT